MIRPDATLGRPFRGLPLLAALIGAAGCSGEVAPALQTEPTPAPAPAAPGTAAQAPAGTAQPGQADYSGKGLRSSSPEGR